VTTKELPPLDGDEEEPGRPTQQAVVLLDRLFWSITESVHDEALSPVASMSPEERSEILDLANDLRRLEDVCHVKRTKIENLFRSYASDNGARQIPLEDGWLAVEPAKGEYKVDVPALLDELKELKAHGLITGEEIERCVRTVVETRPDNSVLNFLARNRGDEVREAIERHRKFVPGDPFRAKLTVRRRSK